MADGRSIAGLPKHEWRVEEGVVQRLEKETLIDGWRHLPAFDIADAIKQFALTHSAATVELDHSYDDHPDYSCEYSLVVKGWRTVDELELKRVKDAARAKARRDAADRKAGLEAQQRQAAEELARLERELGR